MTVLDRRDDLIKALIEKGLRLSLIDPGLDIYMVDEGMPTLGDVFTGNASIAEFLNSCKTTGVTGVKDDKSG